MDDFSRFSEEAMRSQDGRTVPLRLYPGGPVIGEATFHYDEGEKALKFDAQVTDDKIARKLAEELAPHIFKKES